MLPSLIAVNGVPSAEFSLISFKATILPVTLQVRKFSCEEMSPTKAPPLNMENLCLQDTNNSYFYKCMHFQEV